MDKESKGSGSLAHNTTNVDNIIQTYRQYCSQRAYRELEAFGVFEDFIQSYTREGAGTNRAFSPLPSLDPAPEGNQHAAVSDEKQSMKHEGIHTSEKKQDVESVYLEATSEADGVTHTTTTTSGTTVVNVNVNQAPSALRRIKRETRTRDCVAQNDVFRRLSEAITGNSKGVYWFRAGRGGRPSPYSVFCASTGDLMPVFRAVLHDVIELFHYRGRIECQNIDQFKCMYMGRDIPYQFIRRFQIRMRMYCSQNIEGYAGKREFRDSAVFLAPL